MNRNTRIIVTLVVIAGIWLYQYSARVPHVPEVVITPKTVGVKAGSSSLYPDPTLTPGVALSATAKDICTPGYSKSIRNVPVSEKKQVYSEYGISYPQPQGSYEVDHFISLELGGSNDIANLWPEPANPTPGFHEKDVVENYLHEQVCSGALTLSDAQEKESTDWYAVYVTLAR
jgi:hypothetical protein